MLFLIPVAAFPQERKQVLKTNTLALLLNNYNLAYERAITPASSLIFTANYFGSTNTTSGFAMAGLSAGYRFYPTHATKDAPAGFWVSPRFTYMIGGDLNDTDNSTLRHLFMLGGETGYQIILKSGFAIDLGAGAGFRLNREKDPESSSSDSFLPILIVALGYAF